MEEKKGSTISTASLPPSLPVISRGQRDEKAENDDMAALTANGPVAEIFNESGSNHNALLLMSGTAMVIQRNLEGAKLKTSA